MDKYLKNNEINNQTINPDFGPEPNNDKINKIKEDLRLKIQELLEILDKQNNRILKLQDKIDQIIQSITDNEKEIQSLSDFLKTEEENRKKDKLVDELLTPLINQANAELEKYNIILTAKENEITSKLKELNTIEKDIDILSKKYKELPKTNSESIKKMNELEQKLNEQKIELI